MGVPKTERREAFRAKNARRRTTNHHPMTAEERRARTLRRAVDGKFGTAPGEAAEECAPGTSLRPLR